MQPATAPPSKHARAQKSCAECRRRKQKCTPSAPGTPCNNCVKRWPPVPCVFPVTPKGAQHPSLRSVHVFSASAPKVPAVPSQPAPTPRVVGGILSSINCLDTTPIEPTSRNNELMDFFIGYVSPNFVSIDGRDPPVIFRTLMLPWMLQSPLFPKIALLMASLAQVREMKRRPGNPTEPLLLKSKVLRMMNEAVAGTHDRSDIWRCVIHLVIVEWFWGDDGSMWAHLRGLRDLVASRGGLSGLNDPLFQSVLIMADYAIACCFERGLCVLEGKGSGAFMLPVPTEYSAYLACPVRAHPKTFEELEELLLLPFNTAKLLDDIRALTVAITESSSQASSEASRKKIQSTASFIHKRLQPDADETSSDETTKLSDDDVIRQTVRLAAIIYTESIIKLQPMTSIKSTSDSEQTLARNIKAVSSARWKRMPGVFLWIVLVAVVQPTSDTAGDFDGNSDEDSRRRWLRRKLGAAAQAVGQEEFGLSIAYLRAFWLVQQWIHQGTVQSSVPIDPTSTSMAVGHTDLAYRSALGNAIQTPTNAVRDLAAALQALYTTIWALRPPSNALQVGVE
ncbi:hypothetical protein B0T16DRAFT_497811 [Cercophora newfieldiana]|uniref:Zn(2)-C6 fungal-type domain-containing protein n=1 Tax=Cercophora newfieldiana TaxID=92897 RepID=A0AA39XUC9_9PEZI|nr:hypothetical protein B0T16DRAFT_497811 [Cercophora newfieldiana]